MSKWTSEWVSDSSSWGPDMGVYGHCWFFLGLMGGVSGTIGLWTEQSLPWRDTQAEWMRDQDFSQEFNSSLEQQQCTSNPKGSKILSVNSACSPHAWHPVDTQKIFDELIRNGKVRIKAREQIFIECSLCYNHCLPGMAFNSQKHLNDWLSACASIEHRSILETQDSPSLIQGYAGSDWG